MSRHSPTTSLRQILVHSREAVEFLENKDRDQLDQDRVLNLALTRLIEIIGETARRVPIDIQTSHPELPWQQMIGARNRLIHGYDNVDFDILWVIIKQDLPILISQLERILKEE